MNWLHKLMGLAAATCVLAACGSNPPTATPTPASQPLSTPAASANTPAGPTPPATRTPRPPGTPTPDPPRNIPDQQTFTDSYTIQPGDTLSGIAARFGMTTEELQRLNNIRNPDRLQAGLALSIVRKIEGRAPSIKLLPDSELVNSPSAIGFDVAAFVAGQAGYLKGYTQDVAGETLSGAQIVQRIASQFSVNPRILLAALEYTGGWVTQPQPGEDQLRYPLGYKRTDIEGLSIQLSWTALRLNEGYYGWRLNVRNFARLDDGTYSFVGDRINAGTAGLQNYLAAISTQATWPATMDENSPRAFMKTYERLFGDAWQNDLGVLVPDDLEQPALALPWPKGETWFFTGGPHSAYGDGSPWAALDFTSLNVAGCTPLKEYAVAVADGTIARSMFGEVALSIDDSGDERQGWSVLYLHVGSDNRARQGAQVKAGDRIGHPSCEGGFAVAAHLHIARKYNGEWLNADGDVPFVMGGWVPKEAGAEYDGTLTRGKIVHEACNCKDMRKNAIRN
jgi:LysM repeat protein